MTPQQLREHLAEKHPGIRLATGPTGMYPDGRPALHLAVAHEGMHRDYPQDHEHESYEVAHVATYAPEDGAGYLVTCPEGCKLGTSEHQADEAGARRRVRLHERATSL
jgi:hypothetical protein